MVCQFIEVVRNKKINNRREQDLLVFAFDCKKKTPPTLQPGERILKRYFYGIAILNSESMATLLYHGNPYWVESHVSGSPAIS